MCDVYDSIGAQYAYEKVKFNSWHPMEILPSSLGIPRLTPLLFEYVDSEGIKRYHYAEARHFGYVEYRFKVLNGWKVIMECDV